MTYSWESSTWIKNHFILIQDRRRWCFCNQSRSFCHIVTESQKIDFQIFCDWCDISSLLVKISFTYTCTVCKFKNFSIRFCVKFKLSSECPSVIPSHHWLKLISRKKLNAGKFFNFHIVSWVFGEEAKTYNYTLIFLPSISK